MPNDPLPDTPNTAIERLARVEAHMDTVRTQLATISTQLGEIIRASATTSALGERLKALEARSSTMESQLQSLLSMTATGRGAWLMMLRLGALTAAVITSIAALGPWVSNHVRLN